MEGKQPEADDQSVLEGDTRDYQEDPGNNNPSTVETVQDQDLNAPAGDITPKSITTTNVIPPGDLERKEDEEKKYNEVSEPDKKETPSPSSGAVTWNTWRNEKGKRRQKRNLKQQLKN